MRFCGGWLGWTSQQALSEDLNYITAAYLGYVETLENIFGTTDDLGPTVIDPLKVSRGADGKPIQLTPDIFDTEFTDANKMKQKKMN